MDALDKKIILELMQDCRQTHGEIAKKLETSVSRVRSRLKKLEQEGVIENYVTELATNLFREGFIFSHVRTGKSTGLQSRDVFEKNLSRFL